MSYSVKWHEKAIEDLKDVDKKSAKGLIERVKNYLPEDPLSLGKPLKGIFKGLYRYRFGDYRVIYSIDKKENTILILRVGKRKDVYNNK
ncbi:MAG TPA: type II toxin-antitoxin system RelE/ParE family toxin [Thermodesulfobacteriota bacterium]|nr:type II toxin-antitoxin system RelE/ParE family toxin [Thermodesulfobacteriota bacterium]